MSNLNPLFCTTGQRSVKLPKIDDPFCADEHLPNRRSRDREHDDGGQQGDEEKGLPVYPDNRTSNLALVKRDHRGGCVISDIQMSTRLSQAQRQ
jgi:hypothetical protein